MGGRRGEGSSLHRDHRITSRTSPTAGRRRSFPSTGTGAALTGERNTPRAPPGEYASVGLKLGSSPAELLLLHQLHWEMETGAVAVGGEEGKRGKAKPGRGSNKDKPEEMTGRV